MRMDRLQANFNSWRLSNTRHWIQTSILMRMSNPISEPIPIAIPKLESILSQCMLPFTGMIGFPPALSYDIYRLCCLALFPDGPFGDPGGVRDDIYTTDCRRPLTTSNQIVHQTRTHTDKRGTVALEGEPRRAERAHSRPIQRNCFFHSQTFPPTHHLLDPTQR